MEKIEERAISAIVAPALLKELRSVLQNRRIGDGQKLDEVCRLLPEFSAAAGQIENELEVSLNPNECGLEAWWAAGCAGSRGSIVAKTIDRARHSKNQTEFVVWFQADPHLAPYTRLKNLIRCLQEKRTQATPEKFHEVIEKKEKKRADKGYLFSVPASEEAREFLESGKVPQQLSEKYRERGNVSAAWAGVETKSEGRWFLKDREGQAQVTVLHVGGEFLVADRKMSAGDCDEMVKLTREIEDRTERHQKCQNKLEQIEGAFHEISGYPNLGITRAQVEEVYGKLGDLCQGAEEEGESKKWCVHVHARKYNAPASRSRRSYAYGILVAVLTGLVYLYVSLVGPEKAQSPLPAEPSVLPAREPVSADDYVQRGNRFFEQGYYDLAIEDYDCALKLDPNLAEVYLNRGIAYSRQNQYDQAIDDYTRALNFDPQMAQACFQRGNVYLTKGSYPQAIEDLNRALEIYPDMADAYLLRGTAYSRQNQYEQAIEDYTSALKLDSQMAQACFNRGNVYLSQGRYQEAIEDINRAIELNPNLAEAYVSRGTIYSVQNRYDQSIEDYNRAIKLDPNLARAYVNRGTDYSRQNQYGRAIEDYDRALTISPNLVQAYINRGIAWVKQGEYDRAIEDFSQALKVQPESASIYLNRGKVYLYQKRYRLAVDDLRGAVNLDPALEEAYAHLGSAHYQLGEYEEALKNFNRAVELNPNLFQHLENYMQKAGQNKQGDR